MNKARRNENDYIDFLIATPHNYSYMEATKVQPKRAKMPGHDAFTRLLTRLELSPKRCGKRQRARSRAARVLSPKLSEIIL